MAHMKDHQVHGLSSDEANMTSQMTACQPEQIYQSSFHPPTPPQMVLAVKSSSSIFLTKIHY